MYNSVVVKNRSFIMKEYTAKMVSGPMNINDTRWGIVDSAELDYVWENSFPSPYKTRAQVVHSDEGITVRLTTDEWPITVTAMTRNECVCIDSCMELFFIPNMDDEEYINLEMNPAAITLTAKGAGRFGRTRLDIHGENIKVESHIIGECGWTAMAFISYEFLLKHYSRVGKVMRANFYKCGDKTVRKHFSTWNPVLTEAPDYHRPEYFGKIILSDEKI